MRDGEHGINGKKHRQLVTGRHPYKNRQVKTSFFRKIPYLMKYRDAAKLHFHYTINEQTDVTNGKQQSRLDYRDDEQRYA